MNRFEINWKHVKEQFERRYKQFAGRTNEIIDRVADSLQENTPDDWRLTESPSSRFFVIEAESNAKFLGMSYRKRGMRVSAQGDRILHQLQPGPHPEPD